MNNDILYEGHRIEYETHGEGDRVLVLVHGLLMSRRMYSRLAPELADHGNRVVCIDMLGHGGSDRPEDLRLYSMPLFARQVAAVLDHLEVPTAVIGGTSLGANVALELAVREPERARALFIEMPVLDNALPAVVAVFAPLLLGLRFGRPAFELLSRVTSTIPRSLTCSTSGSTSCGSAPAHRARCSRGCCWERRPRIVRIGAGSSSRRWWSAIPATRSIPSATPGCCSRSCPTPACWRRTRSSSGS